MRARLLAAAVALSISGTPAAAEVPTGSDGGRLVLVVVVDQLRPDRLTADLPGGLGRLVRDGRVYTNAVHDHAITATCPGHTAIATGRHPGPAGIPGNHHVDYASNERAYCVADPDSPTLGGDEGRSPRKLRASALGDWIKATDTNARVIAVSAKDRAAITLGGQHGDAAYWLEQSSRTFTTSRHYAEALPDWLTGFNTRFVAALPETWDYAYTSAELRSDDFGGESDQFSRTAPHPLASGDEEDLGRQLYMSPFADAGTLDLAALVIAHEQLGERGSTDVLALALSATDTVGHVYGPYSRESYDTLRRLDEALGRLLDDLVARLGRERLTVVLSADHGVLPLPETLAAQDALTCPVAGGRLGLRSLAYRLIWHLHVRHGRWLGFPARDWLTISGAGIGVNRARAAKNGVEVDAVVATVEAYLEGQPGVAEVWTRTEIADPSDDTARLYRNSFDAERSGDLFLQLEPTCLISTFEAGTGHGSPYDYDRRVPLVFWGEDLAPERIAKRVRTIDIAPTLAKRLGLDPPPDVDGQPLF